MTSQLQQLPAGAPGFGYGFNYAAWTADTTVTLANVSWNSDYRDVVRFANQAALDAHLNTGAGPVISTGGVTYAPMGRPIRLPIPFNAAYRFNYLRATNGAQPIAGGDTAASFYYFIQEVTYITPDVTEFILQLDVWQTFGYKATFGNCYIERGHIGIANENAFNDYGREYLTIPEGLDIGGEYQVTKQYQREIATARNLDGDPPETGSGYYDIMVVTTVSLESTDFGTLKEPKLESATGSNMENLPNGAEIWIFNPFQFGNFLKEFSTKPWVTQGIISVTAVPIASTYDIPLGDTFFIGETSQARRVGPGSLTRKTAPLAPNWRDTISFGRYNRLTKFKTYPYMVIELTSYSGTPLMIKPESWADPDGTVVEVPHFAPPSPRLTFYPYRYNASNTSAYSPVQSDTYGVYNDGGEFLDMATGIFNFPTFSIVNNGYMSFMAANANSIAYQHSSADWAQQRALAGATNAYNQAGGAISTSKEISGMGISAATQQTNLANETAGWQAIQSGGNSIIGGIGKGGAGVGSAALGAANAAAGYAITTNQNTQSMGISNTLAAGTNRAQNAQSRMVADTNLTYANMAAQGDYANTIAGINAKVQDAKLIQPTTSGQMGGDAFTLANYKWGYDVKIKTLQPASTAAIGEFWLRYGYAINRFGTMPANFMVMQKFTYWKLRETYIDAAECPETFKQTLRGIFEKGVTVWANPNDIGNIDIADNAPLAGVTL